MIALEKDHDAGIAQYLLDHGAKSDGVTPLMLAVIARDVGKMKNLLLAGADPDVVNRYGKSAMHYAAPSRECLEVLLQAGAGKKFSGMQVSAMQASAMLNDTNRLARELGKFTAIAKLPEARRALHLAILYDSREAVQLLLSQGVDTGLDLDGQLTALCDAAHHGRIEIIRLLLQAGADPSTLCDGVFRASYYAAVAGHTNCYRLLAAREKAAREKARP